VELIKEYTPKFPPSGLVKIYLVTKHCEIQLYMHRCDT